MRYEMILNGYRYEIIDRKDGNSFHIMCQGVTYGDAKRIVDALNQPTNPD